MSAVSTASKAVARYLKKNGLKLSEDEISSTVQNLERRGGKISDEAISESLPGQGPRPVSGLLPDKYTDASGETISLGGSGIRENLRGARNPEFGAARPDDLYLPPKSTDASGETIQLGGYGLRENLRGARNPEFGGPDAPLLLPPKSTDAFGETIRLGSGGLRENLDRARAPEFGSSKVPDPDFRPLAPEDIEVLGPTAENVAGKSKSSLRKKLAIGAGATSAAGAGYAAFSGDEKDPEKEEGDPQGASAGTTGSPDDPGAIVKEQVVDLEAETRDAIRDAAAEDRAASDRKFGKVFARLDKLRERIPEDQRTDWNSRYEAVKADYEKKKGSTQWMQAAETIGGALVKLGAAYHGLRTGVDMSGVSFEKSDWSSEFDRQFREYSSDVSQIDKDQSLEIRGNEKLQGQRDRLDDDRARYEFTKASQDQQIDSRERGDIMRLDAAGRERATRKAESDADKEAERARREAEARRKRALSDAQQKRKHIGEAVIALGEGKKEQALKALNRAGIGPADHEKATENPDAKWYIPFDATLSDEEMMERYNDKIAELDEEISSLEAGDAPAQGSGSQKDPRVTQYAAQYGLTYEQAYGILARRLQGGTQ